jgi:hypothetical protein
MFIDIDQSRLESVHITYYTSRQSIHGYAKTPRCVGPKTPLTNAVCMQNAIAKSKIQYHRVNYASDAVNLFNE